MLLLNPDIYKLLIKTSQNLTDRLFNHNETKSSSNELTQRITIQFFFVCPGSYTLTKKNKKNIIVVVVIIIIIIIIIIIKQ